MEVYRQKSARDWPTLFRELYKRSYLMRNRYRKTRRSIEDVIRLGLVARELIDYYIKVVKWDSFDRVLEA